MDRIKSTRPSPAIIVAVLALVAALAGTAVAGPSASTSKITRSKVKTIANKQIDTRFPIGAGELGPIEVRTAGGSVAPGTLGDFTATCAAGQKIIGGGVVRDSATTALQLLESGLVGNGWRGQVYSTSAAAHQVTVQALCLTP